MAQGSANFSTVLASDRKMTGLVRKFVPRIVRISRQDAEIAGENPFQLLGMLDSIHTR
jgi:hypothetical protein